MSTRITEAQTVRSMLVNARANRREIDRLSNDISSGVKVREPFDSIQASSISQYKQTLERYEAYNTRIAAVESYLTFQDDALKDVQNVITRLKEIATQAANEPNGSTARSMMAEEVWQIRDNLVALANSTYQGRYIWHGGADNVAPYAESSVPYTLPASGPASRRFVYNESANPGAAVSKSVQLTDDLAVTISTPGNQIFNDVINAVERLGRALSGFRTEPATGQPNGLGTAFVFPDDLREQTEAIQGSIDLLNTARDTVQRERVDLGGRLRRLETGRSLLELNKTTILKALDTLQTTDIAEAATQLTQAQTALQASLTVSSRVLSLSILDFL